MPHLIYETQHMKIFLDEEKNFMEIVLLHLFGQVDTLKKDLLKFLEVGKKHGLKKNLWNLINFEIVLAPELQTWIDTNINQVEIEWGVNKEAFVLQDDIIAELGVSQTMEDQSYGLQIQTAVFGSYQQACTWLLKDKNT